MIEQAVDGVVARTRSRLGYRNAAAQFVPLRRRSHELAMVVSIDGLTRRFRSTSRHRIHLQALETL